MGVASVRAVKAAINTEVVRYIMKSEVPTHAAPKIQEIARIYIYIYTHTFIVTIHDCAKLHVYCLPYERKVN
jgi:hypothetical protein